MLDIRELMIAASDRGEDGSFEAAAEMCYAMADDVRKARKENPPQSRIEADWQDLRGTPFTPSFRVYVVTEDGTPKPSADEVQRAVEKGLGADYPDVINVVVIER